MRVMLHRRLWTPTSLACQIGAVKMFDTPGGFYSDRRQTSAIPPKFHQPSNYRHKLGSSLSPPAGETPTLPTASHFANMQIPAECTLQVHTGKGGITDSCGTFRCVGSTRQCYETSQEMGQEFGFTVPTQLIGEHGSEFE